MRKLFVVSWIVVIFNVFLGCSTEAPKDKKAKKETVTGGKLDEALASLAHQIEVSMTESEKTRIAVIEFSDLRGNVTDFGKFLSEELISRLSITKKFEVIERNLLNKVMAEHKLQFTDLIEPKSIKELGKILGVDAIVSGTITDLGDYLKVNARIIATETGTIFSTGMTKITKDKAVEKLMRKVTEKAVGVSSKEEKTPLVDGESQVEKVVRKVFEVTYPNSSIEHWGGIIRGVGAQPGYVVKVYIRADKDYYQGNAVIQEDGSWERQDNWPTGGYYNTVFAKLYDSHNLIAVSNKMTVFKKAFEITYPTSSTQNWNGETRGIGAFIGYTVKVYIHTNKDYHQGDAQVSEDGTWVRSKTWPTSGCYNTVFAKLYNRQNHFVTTSNKIKVYVH